MYSYFNKIDTLLALNLWLLIIFHKRGNKFFLKLIIL